MAETMTTKGFASGASIEQFDYKAWGEILVDILGNQYSAKVVMGFTKIGVCVLHDVVKMTPASFKYKTRDALSVISLSSEHPQKRLSLNSIIPQSYEKSTPSAKKDGAKLPEGGKASLDIDSIMEQTRSKVHAEPADAKKPKLKESISTAWTNLQISFTNEHSFFLSGINMFEIKKILINY